MRRERLEEWLLGKTNINMEGKRENKKENKRENRARGEMNDIEISMLQFLGVVTLVFLGWVYLRWRRVRRYWAERGVSHTPPNPVFGSLAFLRYENPSVWMRKQMKTHPGPYFGMWCFWKPALVVQNPELARRVLVKDSNVFRDRFLSSGKYDPIGGLNIFTANDPLWTTVRRRLTSAFTAAKLRSIQPLITEKTVDLIGRIRRDYLDGNNWQTLNLKDLFADYTTDIISTAVFGLEGHATSTGDSPMRAVTRDFASYNLKRTAAFISIFFAPYCVDFFRFTFFPKETTRFFREVFDRIVEQRGGWEAGARKIENRDLVDALLRLPQASDLDGIEITKDVVLAQAAILLQGGFETTAVTLSFTVYELAYNPHVQERLHDELAKAKSKKGGELDPCDLSELTYLSCIIKESLRKYPAMGWLDRIAAFDYEIDESLTIPRGTPVYVNAVGMHYSSEYFPDPLKYDPERFLPENEANIKPFTYIPFGDGPRNCIGMRLAQQNLRFAITALVLNYEVKPLEGAPPPDEVGVDNKALFLSPGCRLAVRFIPRTDSADK